MKSINKALVQLLLFGIITFALFFALLQINWISKVPVDKLPDINQSQVDDFLWKQMSLQLNLKTDSDSTVILTRKLFTALSIANGWNDTIYHLHLDNNKVVNAFAYPGNHIVINTELIKFCKTEGELISVIAHEAAHLNEDHPMTLLKREIGVSLISAAILGNNNGKVLRDISKTLTLTAYQREEESTADRLGLQYLIKAELDPIDFINVQKELAKDESEVTKSLEWINSHPNWEQRINDIEVLIKELPKLSYTPRKLLTTEEWSFLKASLE